MSLFGFAEATSIAAWAAVAVTCLPFHYMHGKKSEAIMEHPLRPTIMPNLGTQFVVWLVVGALWVIAMFYLTKVSAPDSWQLITGMVLFLTHALLTRAWHMLFWRTDYKRASFGIGWLVLLTAIGLSICSGVEQTDPGKLYLIPTIIFAVYSGLIFLKLYSNYWYIKKHHHKKHDHHESSHGQHSSHMDYEEYTERPNGNGQIILSEPENGRMHYSRRK